MIRSELAVRVATLTAIAIGVLAAAAGWLAGLAAGLGVLAAGAISIPNFLWLTRGVAGVAAAGDGRRAIVGWGLAAGGRMTVLLAACAIVLASGSAHPVALVAGLTVLPVAVIVEALRTGHPRGGS